jgi:hypothetical protein
MQYFSGVYTIQKLVKCQHVSERATVAGRPRANFHETSHVVGTEAHRLLFLVVEKVLNRPCQSEMRFEGHRLVGFVAHYHSHNNRVLTRRALTRPDVQPCLLDQLDCDGVIISHPRSPAVLVQNHTKPLQELDLRIRHTHLHEGPKYYTNIYTKPSQNKNAFRRFCFILLPLSNLSA